MNTNTNTNTNTLKRLKKFESEFRGVKSNPFYEKIKAMYTSGEMRMLPSVRNLFDKVKFNKTTKLVRAGAFKAIESVENKIIEKKIIENKKINQEIKAQLNKQIIAKSSVQNVLASNVYKTYETIVNNAFLNKHIDSTYTPFYNFYGFSKVANNNSSYYIQTVTYYDESNNKLSGEIIKNGEVLNVSPNIFQTSKVDKKFNNKIYFEMTPNEYQWTPRTFIKDFNINGSVRIITTAYNILIKNKISPSEIIQIYKDNDSGTCLYDGVFNYFVSKKDENPKYKTIYNRLISIEGLEYKRAYTDETIITLCNFIDSTIIIRDLINGADKVFKVDNARYTIEFLNTKINHLDRLVNSHNIKEVDTDTMTQLKTDSPFYIEKQGQLITPECSYKLADDDFQIVYKKWKKDIKYSSNFINKNDDEYHMISSYDYNMHRFFNDDMIVDDSLYKEIDLKKAYYNYSDKTHNKFYNGLPSGSFINVKINNNFTIDTFNKQYNNKLIGFYEVKILKINANHQHFKVLGFVLDSKYVLTSAMIELLKSYMEFEFLNISFSPSVHMPFNKDFLRKTSKSKNNAGLSYYCKAYGLMFLDNEEIITNIKPLNQDMEYYKILQNEKYEMSKVNDIIKIIEKNNEPKSRLHLAMYIHSYVKTLIINQVLSMDITKVYGVKLDSIVCDLDCNINSDIFDVKPCKIENLLKRKNLNSDLDYGLDIITENEATDTLTGSFNPYILTNDEVSLRFSESFLQTGEVITSKTIYLKGMGGSGKTHSVIYSSLNPKYICYTTAGWNLIQSKKAEVPGLIGYSLQKLTGVGLDGKKCEVVTNVNIKVIIEDEMTLIKSNYTELIMERFTNAFIFLIGDMDDDHIYQCTMPNIKIFNPCNNKNIQSVLYTKNYRFDDELNRKLIKLRHFQKANEHKPYANSLIDTYVKKEFAMCFYDKFNIIINSDDMCISSVNDTSVLDRHFIEMGSSKKYFIDKTEFCKGLYKGAEILGDNIDNCGKPIHNNFIMTLFKSIHSCQGLTAENKLIISNTKNFNYQLWYTALSRAKSLKQIKIIK